MRLNSIIARLAFLSIGGLLSACSVDQAAPFKCPVRNTRGEERSFSNGDAQLAAEGVAARGAAQLEARIAGGGDPVNDARQAVAAGSNGLIAVGDFGSRQPNGVICFTPFGIAPELAARIGIGDVLTAREVALLKFAERYNRTAVVQPNYRDTDLCRVSVKSDSELRGDIWLDARSTPVVLSPVTSLHQAARRGDRADIRRWLTPASLNEADGVSMTPLAWAVARDRPRAIEALLEARADPWFGGSYEMTPIYLAALKGRADYFDCLRRLALPSLVTWPPRYVAAAVAGGNSAIIRRMLSEPHYPVHAPGAWATLPEAASLELLLKSHPDLATPLLWEAVQSVRARPDVIALGLRYGGDPDARAPIGSYGTLLGRVSNGSDPASEAIVRMLLAAHADPNLISHRERPLQIAKQARSSRWNSQETRMRAAAIADALKSAGARE